MRSSYAQNNFSEIFELLCLTIRPQRIVEFGILDGYSLQCFTENSNAEITALDLFDDFPYNSANFSEIKLRFPDVNVIKGDFFRSSHLFDDSSIDILHIDIANNGAVYEFAFEHYWPKVRGVMILEGGSEERDHVSWMSKYDKPKIRPVIYRYQSIGYKIKIFEKYPSLTLVFR